MKTKPNLSSAGIALFLLFSVAPIIHAQGPLDPPAGPPGDTMKSLQEIWDKLGEMEAQLSVLATHLIGGPGIEMVSVANPGNADDILGMPNPAGAVSYEYKIGIYEVTNTQYAQFLNAVAESDPNSLYNASMGSDPRGGITRSGASPNFTYAVKANMVDKPVNFVNWYDAARFCNWLHNGRAKGGQVAATTEGGAYTLTGATSIAAGSDPTHGANGRNAGALYHLPGEDEWYKAAYFEPGAVTGDANEYWVYPTRSDSAPTVASADIFGNIDNDTANIANYDNGAEWNGQVGNVTTVGSGGTGSQSHYGAADMGGNVAEWTERLAGSFRRVRGGSWITNADPMKSSVPGNTTPSASASAIGFRVASPQ